MMRIEKFTYDSNRDMVLGRCFGGGRFGFGMQKAAARVIDCRTARRCGAGHKRGGSAGRGWR
ncbi:hypothetical protein SBV1_90020 [Verrucomicrobia bacterium]|nr:hypothetical protein SBV1_90020 [Verrucomicrobiota bacterium]